MNFWDMHGAAQVQRSYMLPAVRAVNTSMDALFYDVNGLSMDERAKLSAYSNPEGSVLVVGPKKDGEEISNYTSYEFISSQKEKGAQPVEAVVVAGVGSSALGTAALARNVAEKLNCPVAGIVSGFGLADLASEALGGWFVLGIKNGIRDGVAKTFDEMNMQDHVWDDTSYNSLVREKGMEHFDMDSYVFGSPDSATLLLVLYHLRKQIKVFGGKP